MHNHVVVVAMHLCNALGLWNEFIAGNDYHVGGWQAMNVLVLDLIITSNRLERLAWIKGYVLLPVFGGANCESYSVIFGIKSADDRVVGLSNIPKLQCLYAIGKCDSIVFLNAVKSHAQLIVLRINKSVVLLVGYDDVIEPCTAHYAIS